MRANGPLNRTRPNTALPRATSPRFHASFFSHSARFGHVPPRRRCGRSRCRHSAWRRPLFPRASCMFFLLFLYCSVCCRPRRHSTGQWSHFKSETCCIGRGVLVQVSGHPHAVGFFRLRWTLSLVARMDVMERFSEHDTESSSSRRSKCATTLIFS